jgi:hypothetical protein
MFQVPSAHPVLSLAKEERKTPYAMQEDHVEIKEQKIKQITLLKQKTEKMRDTHQRKTFLASLGCPSTGQ